jgi:hypothetical protein
MKNLMKKIATSLGLTLMVASLVAISHNQAQAKVKKKAGNSAKVIMQDIHFTKRKGSGSHAKSNDLEEVLVTGKANSQAKGPRTRNGKVRAGWDIRQPKM